jgi:hypothetical protein
MPEQSSRDLIAFELSREAYDALARAPALGADAARALAAGERVERAGKTVLSVSCLRQVAEEIAAVLRAESRTSLGPGGWERALACASAAHAIESALGGRGEGGPDLHGRPGRLTR